MIRVRRTERGEVIFVPSLIVEPQRVSLVVKRTHSTTNDARSQNFYVQHRSKVPLELNCGGGSGSKV